MVHRPISHKAGTNQKVVSDIQSEIYKSDIKRKNKSNRMSNSLENATRQISSLSLKLNKEETKNSQISYKLQE